MEKDKSSGNGLVVFYSYSHVDETLRQQLETHLALLRRRGAIREWHDRKIPPGSPIDPAIADVLESADIILLLISSDFLASDYCYDKEMARALERHRAGEAVVIPIILRPVDFEDSPFAGLLALPTDAKPITTWPNRDEAWLNVAKGIRGVCENSRDLQGIARGDVPPAADESILPEPEEDDYGILDFSAELETALAVATECMTAMTTYAEELTEKLHSGTDQNLLLKASTFPNKASRARQIATAMAGAIASYAKKLENTGDELGEAWGRVDRFFPKLMTTGALERDVENVPGLRAAMSAARGTFRGARESALGAKDSAAELGKLSGTLKLGTNRAQKALQGIADQCWRMEQSLDQMLSLLDDKAK